MYLTADDNKVRDYNNNMPGDRDDLRKAAMYVRMSTDHQKYSTQNTVGGNPYSRGALYSILKNPIYIGKIRHKDQSYDGQHEAIIQQETWDGVQEKLLEQASTKCGHKKAVDLNLLKGLLFDSDGTPYSPMSTKKKSGQLYRYYISQNLMQYRDHPKGTMARLPAYEVEKVVTNTIRKDLLNILELDQTQDHAVIRYITTHTPLMEEMVRISVTKTTLDQDTLHIDVGTTALRQTLEKHLELSIPERYAKASHTISVPFTTRRSYRGAIIIKAENTDYDPFDLPPYQLSNLVRGIIWRDEHFAGTLIKDIATRENVSESGVRKIIKASFDTLQAA